MNPEQREAKARTRFAAKVEKNRKGCWLWTGRVLPTGYGQFFYNGKHRRAHRVAYEWAMGPIPEGLEIDHLCRVRNCVNPKHMEAVTHRENVLRGQTPTGINARKTHCSRGHEFDEGNTYYSKYGRQCRWCARLTQRARAKQRREQAA